MAIIVSNEALVEFLDDIEVGLVTDQIASPFLKHCQKGYTINELMGN